MARTADELLEATVVGSFSSVGARVRKRTAGWGLPPRMDGRVVLITGATSGIGLATAVGMARLGAIVRIVARGKERAEQALAIITEAAPASMPATSSATWASSLRSGPWPRSSRPDTAAWTSWCTMPVPY